MKTKNTFSVIFHQRFDKTDEMKTAPVFMRVTVNGNRVEISTSRRFYINRWKNGQPKGKKADAIELAKYLGTLKQKVLHIYYELIDRKENITAKNIKKRYYGIADNKKTLMQTFDYHNKQMYALIGKNYRISTYKRYETTKKHIADFLEQQYQINDIFLSELNYEFITNFELYLKTIKKCDYNTAVKYAKNLRKIINTAIKYEWLFKDPFLKYEARIQKVERNILMPEELNKIETLQTDIQRIQIVKDIFVFSCYTGLTYAEVANLTNDHIITGIDGEKWINIKRTKNDIKSTIPLLPAALSILEKYKDYNKVSKKKYLLPVISNQKLNSYLKEVASLCSISKNLTFQLARHTFATTVTLTNGISIGSVNAIPGNKSILTTKIYSKIIEEKIGNDTTLLKAKLPEQSNDKKIIVRKKLNIPSRDFSLECD